MQYLGTGDRSKYREFFAQFIVSDRVVEILHVQVDAVVTTESLRFDLLKLLLQLRLSLGFLLSAADVQLMSIDVLAIQLLYGLHHTLTGFHAPDKT